MKLSEDELYYHVIAVTIVCQPAITVVPSSGSDLLILTAIVNYLYCTRLSKSATLSPLLHRVPARSPRLARLRPHVPRYHVTPSHKHAYVSQAAVDRLERA